MTVNVVANAAHARRARPTTTTGPAIAPAGEDLDDFGAVTTGGNTLTVGLLTAPSPAVVVVGGESSVVTLNDRLDRYRGGDRTRLT